MFRRWHTLVGSADWACCLILGCPYYDPGSRLPEVLADAFFVFFGAGWRDFFSSWSACRCALSALVRFSAMWITRSADS